MKSSGVLRFSFLFLVCIVLSACAVGRTTVEVKKQFELENNPAEGVAVQISEVTDSRAFKIKPANPYEPSVDPSETEDISASAVGRKRGGFGKAFGSVVLANGETVNAIIEDAVKTGYQKAGYRVLPSEGTDENGAMKVKVVIEKFWSWFNPGFWAVTVSNQASVELMDEASSKSIRVETKVSDKMQAVTDSDWAAIISAGLDSLIEEVAQAVSKQ